jgi:hypothetical protein
MSDAVFKRAFTVANIARGWRLGGLHPFDITAVPETKLSPDDKKVTINVEQNVYPNCSSRI